MYSKIIFVLLFIPFWVGAQSSINITLLSHFNDTTLKHVDGDQIWSDVMGWKDTIKNKEYLIAGSTDSIYFFDITNPTQMIKCDVEFGHSRNAINRDYETYDHYVYCVSDRTSPLGSLQIFDMQYLPDSVHLVYDDDTHSLNTHTLFIESSSKRLYLCGNVYSGGSRSMAILSLENPENPVLLGELNPNLGCPYTHEVFVQKDTAYCSCGNYGLHIYDVSNPQQTVSLSSIIAPYPGSGYNHSSWLDSSGRYLMFSDENQGSPIKVYDMNDFGAPDIVTYFNSAPSALPHNAYWKGRFAYASMYEDGVYIFDMQNISNMNLNNPPPVAGYFDTYSKNTPGVYNGFHGCWGVWPFLPSGVILASDISEGLFVLQPSTTLGLNSVDNPLVTAQVFPNPFTESTTVTITSPIKQLIQVEILTLQGQLVFSKQMTITPEQNSIELNDLVQQASGLMQLRITGTTFVIHKPLLKI
jgi:choice-of-anchor B domain-containing protein